ncbi:hypothetical protein RM533_00430 [Croceicoccus sp. F390]|uniref:Uncharacterized protein n=1 Tax=Croceicoccus esteveae TaxID=3075597 RepID=A0ABU2ZDH2_9SPHN|nr:hypothetical protein [Croceicoccus sp. F390]MDT0574643.1 hypothetical protein [Croceicoccus sp. F390]
MSDPAASRFLAIQMVRIAGVSLTVYALLVLRSRAPWPASVPVWFAAILLLTGLLGAFIAPQLLARRWRSNP